MYFSGIYSKHQILEYPVIRFALGLVGRIAVPHATIRAVRLCHPLFAEEHLLPLIVVAGAAGDDPAEQGKVQPYRPDLDDGA